jgi:hypothetical protein
MCDITDKINQRARENYNRIKDERKTNEQRKTSKMERLLRKQDDGARHPKKANGNNTRNDLPTLR